MFTLPLEVKLFNFCIMPGAQNYKINEYYLIYSLQQPSWPPSPHKQLLSSEIVRLLFSLLSQDHLFHQRPLNERTKWQRRKRLIFSKFPFPFLALIMRLRLIFSKKKRKITSLVIKKIICQWMVIFLIHPLEFVEMLIKYLELKFTKE